MTGILGAVVWAGSLLVTAAVTMVLTARVIKGRTPPPSRALSLPNDPLRNAPLQEETATASSPEAPKVTEPQETPQTSELQLHRDLQTRLAHSIVDQLRATTDPLGANLLDIRTGLVTLADQVRSHEQVASGARDREWLRQEAEMVKADMAQAARLTRDTNRSMTDHFQALKKTLDTVLEVNNQIVDLSERINVLSINASIEAARAGDAGRGFKVIAGHVKALALETTGFLSQVKTTLQGAEALFHQVDRDLDAKGTAVEALLNKQEGSFVSLQQHYLHQGQRFEELCRTIEGFVGRLDRQVTHLSPLVQVHEVTVQELENLNRVFQHVLDGSLARLGGDKPDAAQVQAWGAQVREHLTTAGELQVLDAVMTAWGCQRSSETQPTPPPALELF